MPVEARYKRGIPAPRLIDLLVLAYECRRIRGFE